jgi:hypothetical protein
MATVLPLALVALGVAPHAAEDASTDAAPAEALCEGLPEDSLDEIPCPVPGEPTAAEARTQAATPEPHAEPMTRPTGVFEILGQRVPPGTAAQTHWTAGQSFAGAGVDTPVHILNGVQPGPTVCLFAAVHGDELNGIEIVRRVLSGLNAVELNGTVVGVPIVNLLGFTRGSRYLPDRRDLNRYFPGNPEGSAASRIAYLFFEQIVRYCGYAVDFHTGSASRSNLPQLRADLESPSVIEFTRHFGATAVLHNPGAPGMLRREATLQGIPTLTFELGEPATVQPEHVEYGVKAIDTLLEKLGMIERFRLWAEPQPVYYASRWVRASRGGILMAQTKLGARVATGDVLGSVTNPVTNESSTILAPVPGRVLGLALNQFVLPGFAAFHIGVEPDNALAAAASPVDEDVDADTEQEPEALGDEHEDEAEQAPAIDPAGPPPEVSQTPSQVPASSETAAAPAETPTAPQASPIVQP